MIMKKLILVLMMLGLAFTMKAQIIPNAVPFAYILLEFDTIVILPTDNVYGISIFVDESSTDSCDIVGKYYTLDDIETDTVAIAPGLNLSVGGMWNRRIDSTSIISRDGCKAIITVIK